MADSTQQKALFRLVHQMSDKRRKALDSVFSDAVNDGVGIMTSNGEHIKRVDFFKQLPEIEEG